MFQDVICRPLQGFFQDFGRGGAKRQYVRRWFVALSTSTELDNVSSKGGTDLSRGANCPLAPPPPLKETLLYIAGQISKRSGLIE